MQPTFRSILLAAGLAVGLFATSAPLVADAALARPPVVQRDANARGLLAVSADGRFALTADDLAGTPNRRVDLVTNAKVTIPFQAFHAHLTADGSVMVFDTAAGLIAADTNNATDVYRYSFVTKALVRMPLPNKPKNWEMSLADINSNGSILAFAGSNGVLAAQNVWIFDAAAKTWRAPETRYAGFTFGIGGRQSNEIKLSASGRLAVFSTFTTVGCTSCQQVVVYNWVANTLSRQSFRWTGANLLDGNAHNPTISADGLVVSFESNASNIIRGITTVKPRVYVRYRANGLMKMVTDKATTGIGGSYEAGPALGANGTVLVVLENRGTTLPGVVGVQQVPHPVLYKLSTNEAVLLDKPSGLTTSNGYANGIIPASAGKRIAFGTTATNFTTVIAGPNFTKRIFVSTLP